MSIFVIEDEIHAEWHGRYPSMKDALAELRRLADIPWNQPPNVAPCTSWKTCGRKYEVVEFDDQAVPWQELRRCPVLDISAQGVFWANNMQK